MSTYINLILPNIHHFICHSKFQLKTLYTRKSLSPRVSFAFSFSFHFEFFQFCNSPFSLFLSLWLRWISCRWKLFYFDFLVVACNRFKFFLFPSLLNIQSTALALSIIFLTVLPTEIAVQLFMQTNSNFYTGKIK